MLVLCSDDLLVRVDPTHGGEILDLVDLATGRQLLGRPPFSSAEPLGGDLTEDVWTERYRGGWQLVTPNAGNPCEVAGERHGFHGCASNDRWQVLETSAARAVLRWDGQRHEIDQGRVVLGRSKDADLQVVDPNVSRRHAELRQEGATYWLIDLDSTNGVEVRGKRVKRLKLEDGTRFTIGSTEIAFSRETA